MKTTMERREHIQKRYETFLHWNDRRNIVWELGVGEYSGKQARLERKIDARHEAALDEFKGEAWLLPDLLADISELEAQVAQLTRERDAARDALKPFAEAYANLPEGQRSVLFDFERNKFMINDMFPDGSTQRCLTTYHLEEAYKLFHAEATPPRLDSEGARLPFALADDGEVSE